MNLGTATPRVLVIDDDEAVAVSLCEFLRLEGYDCAHCGTAREGETLIGSGAYGVALCDISLPGANGLDILRRVARDHPEIAMVMITGYGSIETAVHAIREGAVDFLAKPIIDSELRLAVGRAVRQHTLSNENKRLRTELVGKTSAPRIIGEDHRMVRAMGVVDAVASSSATVLLSGESGTGKSAIAREIHARSPRCDRPFVEVHCGSIPESLLESELFGHMRGAFTGAHADKEGRFARAHTGTIFLDEINTASPSMQVRLLRVLQDRTFEPVGSERPHEVDVRIILASNEPLNELVERGTFREDLYYRINVVDIELPPLRERAGDIAALATHFLELYREEYNSPAASLSEDALRALLSHPMPGNVRELSNIIERAAVLCRGETITLNDLPDEVAFPNNRLSQLYEAGVASAQMTLHDALREPERQILLSALESNNWNRQSTADQLDINRTTLYKKMKTYGLDRLVG
jgi:DNA-binding NtrC family response regulator